MIRANQQCAKVEGGAVVAVDTFIDSMTSVELDQLDVISNTHWE